MRAGWKSESCSSRNDGRDSASHHSQRRSYGLKAHAERPRMVFSIFRKQSLQQKRCAQAAAVFHLSTEADYGHNARGERAQDIDNHRLVSLPRRLVRPLVPPPLPRRGAATHAPTGSAGRQHAHAERDGRARARAAGERVRRDARGATAADSGRGSKVEADLGLREEVRSLCVWRAQ